jgi:hypothetical protein
MSQYSESYTPGSREIAAEPSAADAARDTAEPSATEVARDQAADVGQHARQAGGQVAQTATDQARQVAAETRRQARDLLGEAQGQAREQASAQQQKAAQRLRSVADELSQMAANSGQEGMATNFAHEAAGRLHGAASWLEQRQPADLLDEVRNFARRRPGTFLLGAAAAGIAAGRLTRGLAANDNDNDNDNRRPATGDGTVTQVPATTPADPGVTVPDFPVVPEAADGGVPVYPAEPGYPVGSEPGAPPAPVYPAQPGYPVGSGFGDPSLPVNPPGPAYPAEPPYPAEPGTAPRYEGP